MYTYTMTYKHPFDQNSETSLYMFVFVVCRQGDGYTKAKDKRKGNGFRNQCKRYGEA